MREEVNCVISGRVSDFWSLLGAWSWMSLDPLFEGMDKSTWSSHEGK